MKKTIICLVAIAGTTAIAACGNEAPADDTVVVEDDAAPAPVVIETPAAQADGDSVTIGTDGVTADINDGNTSVTADLDENPSATIKVD